MRVTYAAVMDGYQRRKDKSVSLRFVTQELSAHDVMKIDALLDTYGILYFRGEESINREEMDELDNIDLDLYDEPKSQSQRLRNVLFKVHQRLADGTDFKEYYKKETEKIINHYKDKLDL